MRFIDKLDQAWSQLDSLVCVGLDPDITKLPAGLTGMDGLLEFNCRIIDATAESASAFKPQIAYYAAIGAETVLEKTLAYLATNYPDHVSILDAKRGDIGATAEMYAREAFERYGADAVTVNPYMGGDTLAPYLKHPEKGVIVLCRTSNSGSGEIQGLTVGETTVSMEVARLATEQWNSNHNVSLVVGATWPEEIASVRRVVGDMPLLIPGIGAQGGDLEKVLKAGLDSKRRGLMINSSRGIIYAGSDRHYARSAGAAAQALNLEINRIRTI